MSKKIIRTGTTADPTGDSLKNAFTKVNDNFTELYNALGLDADTLNLGAFEFTGSVMTTTDSSAIVIDQSTTITSNLSVGGDILPQTALGGDLGSSTLPWRSLYVSNNTIYIGGTAIGVDANGQLTVSGSQVNAPSSTLVNGAKTVSLDANGNLTFPQGTLLGYSDPGGFIINGAVDKDIAIYTYNGADAHGWTFGTDGSLTLPGDIKSNGNINIDINLSDSTLRRWQFGEDGHLTLPGGSTIAEVGPFGVLQITPRGGANAYQALMIYPWATAEGDQIHLASGDPTTVDLYLGDNDQYVKIEKNGGDVVIGTNTNTKQWTFGTDGGLTFPDSTVQSTAYIPGDIRSEGDINIDINLSDSTLRRWQFGEDGSLTLPSVGKINNGAYDWTFGSTGNTTFPTGLTLSAARGPSTVNFTSGIDKEFQIETQTNTTGRLWNFSTDGSLTIPGDIKSNGNINIDINLSDSTLRRWQFGEDGELTLPEDAVVKTTSGHLTIKGQEYVYIDSATNGQINIGTSSGVGSVVLGSKSRGTNVVVDDLQVANGVYEFFSSLADATGVVTHNCANGHIFYHTSPDANWTVNLTNLLDTWNIATSVTLIITQGATGYYPSAVQIAGVAQTINWQGNATPTPSTNRTDVVTFSIINVSGTYTVLGQLTGF
jgi:hypothetical protein